MSITHRFPKGGAMRIVAFVLSILLATGLLVGGTVLLVASDPHDDSGWIFGITIAMTVLLYGPLTLGSFRAYWDVSGSESARTYSRRLLLIVLGLQVLAAVTTVVFSIVVPVGVLLPLVFIGGSAVLTVVALLVGPALYRSDVARRPTAPPWVAIEPRAIRNRVVAMGITFVAVLILGLIGGAVLGATAPHQLGFGQLTAFALEFALFGAGFVCVFSTLGWNRRLRDVTGRDPGRIRRVARVVLRNKTDSLDDRDLVAAAKYAAVISITLSFQLAYLVLLYAGLLLQQISSLVDGDGSSFSLVIVIGLIVVLVVLFPLQVSRIRRARRYAAAHGDRLEVPQPA